MPRASNLPAARALRDRASHSMAEAERSARATTLLAGRLADELSRPAAARNEAANTRSSHAALRWCLQANIEKYCRLARPVEM